MAAFTWPGVVQPANELATLVGSVCIRRDHEDKL